MGRKKLTDEEKAISREKRLQYLRDYRKKHGSEYYEKNKERILQHERQKREKLKGAPLNKHTKGVNIKQMSREEWNAYCKEKVRAYRARKKAKQETENKEENKMKKYNIRFVKNQNTFSEITDVEIEDIKKYIDKNITSKEYITYIDEEKGRTLVINLSNVFRVEFEEVKGDD